MSKPSFISVILHHFLLNEGENPPHDQSNIGHIRNIIDIFRTSIGEFYFPKSHINDIRSSINNIKYNAEYLRNNSEGNRYSLRRLKTETAKDRSSFFIDRVESHYANLNRDVYNTLSILGTPSSFNVQVTPLWKSDFMVNSHISDNFLTDSAIQHISTDNQELLNEIKQLIKKMKLYTKNIDTLPSIIDSIVRSKFIEHGIYPVRTGNYERIGYYHFSDIGYQLEIAWKNFLDSGRNIESFITNYNFNGLTFNEFEDYLRLGLFIVRRGNPEYRRKTREILNQIPRNRFILNALNQIMVDKLDIDHRMRRISDLATPLSNAIRDREYRTLCNCCDTQDSSIWNFR